VQRYNQNISGEIIFEVIHTKCKQNSLNICITLNSSTCFEQYYANLQEVKIVFLQHLVSSLSVSGRTVHRLRAVIKISLYYDARSEKHQNSQSLVRLILSYLTIFRRQITRVIGAKVTYMDMRFEI
jgi:hypothetical protein